MIDILQTTLVQNLLLHHSSRDKKKIRGGRHRGVNVGGKNE